MSELNTTTGSSIEQKVFKGFKQVTYSSFSGETNTEGYLWFVRTPENDSNGNELPSSAHTYDIYFGDKHYGHYKESELPSNLELSAGTSGNTQVIVLKNSKTNETITSLDASDFYKDSFLSGVTYNSTDKKLVFSWKTEGNENLDDVEINVTDFAKIYSAGNGVTITTGATGDSIDVAIAPSDNFISINNNKQLIVSGITADKSILNKDIRLQGGPLSDAAKQALDVTAITSGTDVLYILEKLFSNEKYPNVTANTPTYTVSGSVDDITNTNNIANNTLVLIGEEIEFKAVTANTVNVKSTTNPKISPFIVDGETLGYSTGVTASDAIVASSARTGSWGEISSVSGEVYKLEPSITSGFYVLDGNGEATGAKQDLPQIATATTSNDCVLSGIRLKANKGDNTYKITGSFPTQKRSHEGISKTYKVSNFGNRENDEFVELEAQRDITKSVDDASSVFTVTGCYPFRTNVNVLYAKDTEDDPTNYSKGITDTICKATEYDVNKLYSCFNGDDDVYMYIGSPSNHTIKILVLDDWEIVDSKGYVRNAYSNNVYDGTVFFNENENKPTLIINGINLQFKEYTYDMSSKEQIKIIFRKNVNES